MDYKNYRKVYHANQRKQQNDQSGQKVILAAIVILAVLAVILIAVVAITGLSSVAGPKHVARTVTAEVGRSQVLASDFLVDKNHTAEFAEGVSFDLNKVGRYDITLIVDGKKCTSKLIIVDTVAPTATALSVSVLQNGNLDPEECVKDIVDATKVTVSFKKKPNLRVVGDHTTTIILTDEVGNKTEYDVLVTVVGKGSLLFTTYTSDLGQPFPEAGVFTGFDAPASYLSDTAWIDTSVPGEYMIQLEASGKIHDVTVRIRDCTPPTATVTPQTGYGKAPDPSSFISNIVDSSAVTVRYATEPAVLSEGIVKVKLVLTDAEGNSTTYDSYITYDTDDVPPVIISAPASIEITAGDNIIWRAKVQASDDSGVCNLSLDTTGVNTNVPGTYTVYIVAEDPAGNVTRRQLRLIVNDSSVTDDRLNALLETIKTEMGISATMTPEQKVFAVYKFVNSKVKYVNHSAHDDWRREAYECFNGRYNGDCFTFCATSYALLRYLGFDAQIVERSEEGRVPDTGTHYWVMVNIGTVSNPQWYHFDATPQRYPFNVATYLLTTDQLIAFTKWRNAEYKLENYYTFDIEKYPASSTVIKNNIAIPEKYFD